MSTARPSSTAQDQDLGVQQLESLLEACGFKKTALGQSEYITSLHEMNLDGEVTADSPVVGKTAFQKTIKDRIAELSGKTGTIRLIVNTGTTAEAATDAHWALLELNVNAEGKVTNAHWVDSLSDDVHQIAITGVYNANVTLGLTKAGIKDTSFTFTHEEPHQQADRTSCGYYALMNLVARTPAIAPDAPPLPSQGQTLSEKLRAIHRSTPVTADRLRAVCDPILNLTAEATPPVNPKTTTASSEEKIAAYKEAFGDKIDNVGKLKDEWKLITAAHEQSKETYARYIRGCELKAQSVLYSANPDPDTIKTMENKINEIEDILFEQKAKLEAIKELIEDLAPLSQGEDITAAAAILTEFRIKDLATLSSEIDARIDEADKRLKQINECRKQFEPNPKRQGQHIYGTVVTTVEDIPCDQTDVADAIEKARTRLVGDNASAVVDCGAIATAPDATGIKTRNPTAITATQVTVADKNGKVVLDSVTIKTDDGNGNVKSRFMFKPEYLKKIANIKHLDKDSPLMDWALENIKMHLVSLTPEQANEPLKINAGTPPMPDACYKALMIAAAYAGKECVVEAQYRDFHSKMTTKQKHISIFEKTMTKKGMDLSEQEHKAFRPK